MNQYEHAVLQAIASGSDYVGWYKIEQRLSNMDLVSREHLPNALQHLIQRGLIEEHNQNKGTYKVTSIGQLVLARGA
jgi:RIO-like serine/threonine protein kinase